MKPKLYTVWIARREPVRFKADSVQKGDAVTIFSLDGRRVFSVATSDMLGYCAI